MQISRATRRLAIALLFLPVSCAAPPATDDPDALLRESMLSHWSTLERRVWTIDHRAIEGLSGQTAWHITGTQWWVKLIGDAWTTEELDQSRRYDVDGVALDQHYGVMLIYPYRVTPTTE